MLTKIKSLIFDLDGTLVDTADDLGDSVSAALMELGLPTHTIKEYISFVGNGTLMLVKRSLPEELREDEALLNKAHDLFCDHYSKHYLDKSRVYDGIPEVVKALKASGLKLYVLTNKPYQFASEIISQCFPEGTFELVGGSGQGFPRKPDPSYENHLIELSGSDKSETLHIGDSATDIETAHNAGIKCIACTWGFRSRESLIAAGGDFIVDRPEEILDVVQA
ncbi:MAG: HAD-IA family hydrolase [Oscillospiraceae bacterium]|nr:HAD-IA family hydrolase [Ruminococcus sp.]MCD8345581.1 HAD-IA family hydrolase [Oscillospiraceae bacterium]